MKKNMIYALVCMAGLTIVTACGGGNKSNGQSAEAPAEAEQATEAKAKLDKEPQTVAEQKTLEAAEWALDHIFKLTLADVKPDYEYDILDKDYLATMGNSAGGTISFIKKDGTPITSEDFAAYVAKIYPLAQKLSPTGKVHKGMGKMGDNSAEVQKEELPLSEAINGSSASLSFPKKDDFTGGWHVITAYNKTIDGKAYIALQFN